MGMKGKIGLYKVIVLLSLTIVIGISITSVYAGSWIDGSYSSQYESLKSVYINGNPVIIGGFGFKYTVWEAKYYSSYDDWFQLKSGSTLPDLFLEVAWSRHVNENNKISNAFISVKVREKGNEWLEADDYLLRGRSLGIATASSEFHQSTAQKVSEWVYLQLANKGLEMVHMDIFFTLESDHSCLSQYALSDGTHTEVWSFFSTGYWDPRPGSLSLKMDMTNFEFDPNKNYEIHIKGYVNIAKGGEYGAYSEQYTYSKVLYFGPSNPHSGGGGGGGGGTYRF